MEMQPGRAGNPRSEIRNKIKTSRNAETEDTEMSRAHDCIAAYEQSRLLQCAPSFARRLACRASFGTMASQREAGKVANGRLRLFAGGGTAVGDSPRETDARAALASLSP